MEDRKLVFAAMRQDKEAFSQLIRINEARLYKTASAILMNDNDAADALQDAILTAWEKIGTLKEPKYFLTWLTKIVINCCYSLLRKQRKIIPAEELEESAETDSGYSEAELKDLLEGLDEKLRSVIVLYYIQGFKVSEIAEILGINPNTVKSRLKIARSRLEKMIA